MLVKLSLISKKILISTFLLLLLSSTFMGCNSSQYVGLVSTYSNTVDKLTNSLDTYYQSINDYQRNVYLSARYVDPSLKVFDVDENGRQTPLLGYIDQSSIQARLDTIRLLGIYGERLAELINNKSPREFATNSELLGTNLVSLGTQLQSFKNADSNAFAMAGPISSLTGIIGSQLLEIKQTNDTKKAIKEAAPFVRRTLDILDTDVRDRISAIERAGAIKDVVAKARFYNNNKSGMNDAQRKAALKDIEDSAKRFELVKVSMPVEGISSFRDAHEELVRFANGDRTTKENIASLVTALETFQDRVARMNQAVEQIRAISSTLK